MPFRVNLGSLRIMTWMTLRRKSCGERDALLHEDHRLAKGDQQTHLSDMRNEIGEE